jgi:hypothetical protein
MAPSECRRKIVVAQTGKIVFSPTGEVLKFTPNTNPDFAAVICPGFGGTARELVLGGDDLCTIRWTPNRPARLWLPMFPRASVKHVLGQIRTANLT